MPSRASAKIIFLAASGGIAACTAENPAALGSTSGEDPASTEGQQNDPDSDAGEVGDTGAPEDDSTSTSGDGNGGGSETSGDDPGGCEQDDDCQAPGAPFCSSSGECVSCDLLDDGDASCSSVFPDRPFCEESRCVECRTNEECTNDTPVCDDESTCTPCSFHAECDTACEISTGRCFPPTVTHVDHDGGQSYETIQDAIDTIGADSFVVVLHERDDNQGYAGATIPPNRVVAILSAEGESPRIAGDVGQTESILAVEEGSSLYLQGLEIFNTGGFGIEANNASLYIDQTSVHNAAQAGISLSNNASMLLRNAFVARNGFEFEATGGIRASDSSVEILYTSIIANESTEASSIYCDNSTVSVRNSIISTPDLDSIGCPGITASDSALDTSGLGGSNGLLDTFNPTWFENISAADVRLSDSGAQAFGTTAAWRLGDPTVDIDGQPRPNIDGTPDSAGGDVR